MKNRLFGIFASVVVIGFIVLLFFAWPYRGFVPILKPAPVDLSQVIPENPEPTSTSSEPMPGKNETDLPLVLPKGFSINLFAKNLGNPRVLEVDSRGVLLASIPDQGRVVALPDTNKDGVSDGTNVVAAGLTKPHGLAFTATNRLFIAESNAVSVYDYDVINTRADGRKKLLDLPTGGRHWSKTLLTIPDGRLLLSIGSSCDVCREEDERRGAVYSLKPDGSEFKSFSVGLRNSVFLTNGPDGKIWATEMGRDFLGDELPPDEINILEEGKNYGWPICYGKNIHDTQFDKNTYIRNPCMEPFEVPSLIDLPAHSAPLGLVFVPKNAGWPKEYEGNLLVAYHGSWNRTEPTGYKIRRFVLDGQKVVRDEDFLSGWLDDKGVLGRPAGLTFGRDGVLYVSDDRAGLIYRVTPPKR